MLAIAVVHVRSKARGKRVYIGRPGPYGNPFSIGKHGSRSAVIAQYREWLAKHPKLIDKLIAEQPDELACHCAPLACHGNVLVEALEAQRRA
jgi:hypothetical protein